MRAVKWIVIKMNLKLHWQMTCTDETLDLSLMKRSSRSKSRTFAKLLLPDVVMLSESHSEDDKPGLQRRKRTHPRVSPGVLRTAWWSCLSFLAETRTKYQVLCTVHPVQVQYATTKIPCLATSLAQGAWPIIGGLGQSSCPYLPAQRGVAQYATSGAGRRKHFDAQE